MISPIENNGMLIRTQDVSVMHQNDVSKGEVVHVQVQGQLDQRSEQKVHTVHTADDSAGPDTHHDAREEGRNKYFNARKGPAKKKVPEDGKVIAKSPGGFDLKI